MSNSSYNSYLSASANPREGENDGFSMCFFWKSVKHEDEFDMNIDYNLDDTYIIFV